VQTRSRKDLPRRDFSGASDKGAFPKKGGVVCPAVFSRTDPLGLPGPLSGAPRRCRPPQGFTLVGRLLGAHRPETEPEPITIRGDGHYGREEAMTWCENYGIDCIFGLSGNVVLDRLVEAAADDIRVRRAVNQAEVLRGFAETRYAAKSWGKERRVVARIEASSVGVWSSRRLRGRERRRALALRSGCSNRAGSPPCVKGIDK
jgi:hypothetical protein